MLLRGLERGEVDFGCLSLLAFLRVRVSWRKLNFPRDEPRESDAGDELWRGREAARPERYLETTPEISVGSWACAMSGMPAHAETAVLMRTWSLPLQAFRASSIFFFLSREEEEEEEEEGEGEGAWVVILVFLDLEEEEEGLEEEGLEDEDDEEVEEIGV